MENTEKRDKKNNNSKNRKSGAINKNFCGWILKKRTCSGHHDQIERYLCTPGPKFCLGPMVFSTDGC